jgi:diguanylate cyclase (GGDEF)-like protein
MGAVSRIAQLEAGVAAAVDVRERVRAMNALAYELSRTGQAHRAIGVAEEAQALAQPLADPGLTASCVHTLARCRFYLSDFLHALEGLLQAAQLYHATGDLASEATVLAGVGLCQDRLGAHDEAFDSLRRALDAARGQGMATLETNIHNSLAAVSLAGGRLDEAASHAAQGIELARAQGDRNLLTKLLGNDALTAQRRGDDATDPATARQEYEAALAGVEEALLLARELGNRYDEAHCLGISGALRRRLGRRAEAAAALAATLEIGRELGDLAIQAEACIELGELQAADDRPAAQRHFEEAIRLAEGITARNLLAEACKAYSARLEQWGDPAASLALYKRYDAARGAELARARAQAVRAMLMLDFERVTREAVRLAEDQKAMVRETRELTAASQQDPLTGLLNRRGFDAKFAALAASSEADDAPLAFALIDVDNFKRINDDFSHAVGDAVLQRIGRMIASQCRADDLPMRYGGDEFLVALAGAGVDGARVVMHRLKEAVDACVWDDLAAGLEVTVSIGVAGGPTSTSVAVTIADADRALYAAKRGGRNRIVLASDLAARRAEP